MVVTSILYANGIPISDEKDLIVTSTIGENNSASRFESNLTNENGRNSGTFSVGDEMVVFGSDTEDVFQYKFPYTFDFVMLNKVFTGVLEDINFSGKETKERLKITGRDYTARLQDVTVEPVVYNNTEVSAIVKDIISNNVADIATTFVDVTSTTITHISFNHTPVFDALKQLADRSGFFFYVDSDKVLHLEERSSSSSSLTFDNTNVTEAKFKLTDREIANQVWVYGDRQLTGAQNVFSANGGSVFNLTYNPRNTEVFTLGGSVPKIGGVYQMAGDTLGSPLDYLVDFDSRNIIFVSGAFPGFNIPTSGTTNKIVVDYQRDVPIVKYGQDNASISTHGPHSKVIVDKNIKDPRAAEDIVSDELAKNANPKQQGTVQIQGLLHVPAGKTATVNLPYHDINNETFDILEVKYHFTTKNNLIEDVVSVKVATKIADVTDTIKQMILDIKKLQAADIGVGDVLTRLETGTGSFGLRIASWKVQTRSVQNGFILGHAKNGVLGSPAISVSGGQVVLGSDGISQTFTTQASGGTWT